MISPCRDINKLRSDFRVKVEELLKKCPQIFITETWRSQERQNQLLASGASKVKHSNHQDGLAVDIAFRGSELYPKDMQEWKKVANAAYGLGMAWGYDLWSHTGFIDKPHFQCVSLGDPRNNQEDMTFKHNYAKIMEETVPEESRVLNHDDESVEEDEKQIKALVEIANYRSRNKIKDSII